MTRPPPDSALTRAAEALARRRLSPAVLNHSYRTYAFGAALGELESLDVDRELLFAAALLHDIRPTTAAREVAEQVGLSTAATGILLGAVTLQHSSGVTLAHGEVGYLLSAGVALDAALAAEFRS
jgi:HD superfamily phosphohydrolase YqeK